jgi:hypothetical protein
MACRHRATALLRSRETFQETARMRQNLDAPAQEPGIAVLL